MNIKGDMTQLAERWGCGSGTYVDWCSHARKPGPSTRGWNYPRKRQLQDMCIYTYIWFCNALSKTLLQAPHQSLPASSPARGRLCQ